jgi:hypothetical protein
MKTIHFLIAAGVASLVGCASTPVAVKPVGPDPLGDKSLTSQGRLQVFSRLSPRSDDQNQGSGDPVWYQHSRYAIYTQDGRLIESEHRQMIEVAIKSGLEVR